MRVRSPRRRDAAVVLHPQGLRCGRPGHRQRGCPHAARASAAGGTDLTYDADAVVGGTIGGVGQRMLNGVAKKMAGQFFAAVDADIASGGRGRRPRRRARRRGAAVSAASGAAPVTVDSSGARVFPASRRAGRRWSGRRPRLQPGAAYLIGALVGGAPALAGVALGGSDRRRH